MGLLVIILVYGYLGILKDFSIYASGIITGLITFSAMWFIDNENKKRWEREYFQKIKSELILNTITNSGNVLNYLTSTPL